MSVVMAGLSLDRFMSVSCDLRFEAEDVRGSTQPAAHVEEVLRGKKRQGAALRALQVLGSAMRGARLGEATKGCVGVRKGASLTAEFFIPPWTGRPFVYRVWYELALSPGKDAGVSCVQHERLLYTELHKGTEKGRRRAFDTAGIGTYDGLYPREIYAAMGRTPEELHRVCAVRLLTRSLGTSFLFSPEFAPYARRTAWRRPGSYFLSALGAFARKSLCVPDAM